MTFGERLKKARIAQYADDCKNIEVTDYGFY